MNEATLAGPVTRSRRPWLFWIFVIFMLALTALFLGLAKWQLDRLHWKEGLIAEAAANMKLPPAPFPPEAQWPGLDPEAFGYRPVTATGHYIPDQTIRVFVGLSDDAKGQYSGPGYWIVTPFALDGGGTVFIDRGFVPQAMADAFADDPNLPTGTVTLAGVTVPSEEAGPFTPAADTQHRIDWARNIERMQAMLPAALQPVAPVYIDLLAGPRGALPQGGETEVDFPNNHLGYAFTWLGFALTTVIMLAEWVRRQVKRD
ncbi:MAG TPA: SURF1 family protein [Devosia sp.]|nr:SURF1 family protein [Devosia sp.]